MLRKQMFRHFYLFFLLVLLIAISCAPDSTQQRPQFSLSIDEAFDPSTIAPYGGEHNHVYSYIDNNLDGHLAKLQRWIRQPSISAQNNGIQEMARMVKNDLAEMGFTETEVGKKRPG